MFIERPPFFFRNSGKPARVSPSYYINSTPPAHARGAKQCWTQRFSEGRTKAP
jgi:hypothetical protein